MAKEDIVAVASAPAPKKGDYFVVGLKLEKSMPVEHKGVMYDLAHLTEDQAKELIDDGCPYLTKG